jgi:cyclin B
MNSQNDINAKMRAILVDWLVEVHMKFRLVPETLYLCVNIIDRYCKLVQVKRSSLQLVGVTALLIACKYEEIYPPEVRDCVYITDRAYQSSEVLDMEQDIVHKLGFRITVPTAFPFLQRFFTIVNATDLVKHAASYYTERTLQEHDMLKWRPSVICASALVLALNHPEFAREDGRMLNGTGVFLVSTVCSTLLSALVFCH